MLGNKNNNKNKKNNPHLNFLRRNLTTCLDSQTRDMKKTYSRQTRRPDPEMMTSFLTILYEDLLIGEQVDVQTTVHEGLLRGEQADVYSHRSSMSCCGTNSLNVPALQQLPACSSGCFWPGAAAISQGRGRQQRARGMTERWQGGGQ